jgi:hypothetical protein
MKFMVEFHASMERGNTIDQQGGPAAIFGHVAERFKPEAFYANPSRRQCFMVVDLPTDADMAELMYILTWAAGTEPTFTPVTTPATFEPAIKNALKAPALGRPWQ